MNELRNRWLFGCVFCVAAGLTGCSNDGDTERPASSSDGTAGNQMPGEQDTATIDANGELLLDDLADGTDRFLAMGLSGEWFTYSDMTSPVVPADHSGVGNTPGEVHVTGADFSDWGAGLSAYFQNVDLSAFGGLKLRAKGVGIIRVEVATPETSPANEGGTCEEGCFGHYATVITLTEEYQDFSVAFADLVQPGWASQVDLSLTEVISFNFLAPAEGGTVSIDLWVDALSLTSSN